MKKPNIDYVSVLDDIKDIDERNKAFDKLSKEGKRLEIAWDMLKLLMSGVVKPSDGHYWNPKLMRVADSCFNSKELQKEFNDKKNIKGCSVCARGGLMLSQIRLGNSVNPNDTWFRDKGSSENLKGFSWISMRKMENEYEHCTYRHPYRDNTTHKLMNILCNVLVNGDFKVSDKTDYLI